MHQQAALQVQSNFSFQQAASHPEELVRRAAELGLHALALCDDASVAGVVRAHQAAAKLPGALQLLIGASFDVQRNPGRALPLRAAPDDSAPGLDRGLRLPAAPAPDAEPLFRLLLIAPEREAYGNLC